MNDEAARLYGLPLEDFTAARNKAAAAAKQAGDKELAAALAALRKPSLAAWAANQLAHRHPDAVERLAAAGDRLLAAQQALLEGGERQALDDARLALDETIDELVGFARLALGERASDEALRRVAETLRAGALGAEGREQLVRGLLERELSATGWDALATMNVAPAPARAARPTRQKLTELRAALNEARRRRDAAASRVADAQRQRTRARRAFDDAEAALLAATDELERADAEVEAAGRALDA